MSGECEKCNEHTLDCNCPEIPDSCTEKSYNCTEKSYNSKEGDDLSIPQKVKFEIKGDPVPWQSHKGYGKRSYNPRQKEREAVQWQLKSQYQGPLLGGPLQISYTYHIEMPQRISKKERIRMKEGLSRPTRRPDLDNYNKFLNDCLNKTVIFDDSLIVKLVSEKYYSDTPGVVIEIQSLN